MNYWSSRNSNNASCVGNLGLAFTIDTLRLSWLCDVMLGSSIDWGLWKGFYGLIISQVKLIRKKRKRENPNLRLVGLLFFILLMFLFLRSTLLITLTIDLNMSSLEFWLSLFAVFFAWFVALYKSKTSQLIQLPILHYGCFASSCIG